VTDESGGPVKPDWGNYWIKWDGAFVRND